MDKNFYFHYYREFYAEYSGTSERPVVMSGNFHMHNVGELIIVEKGVSTCIIDGSIKSASGSYVIYYPPHTIHQQLNDPDYEYSRYLITLDPAYLEGSGFPEEAFVLPISQDNLCRLVEPIKLLLFYSNDSHMVKRELTEARYNAVIGLIVTELIGMLSGMPEEPAHGRRNYISGVCRYIDQNLTDTLTLDNLAEKFFICRAKLTQDFRAQLGMSVGEYITMTRINKAKQLLNLGKSVSETALLCGFSDAPHFIRTFSKRCGMTPAAYRAKC